MTPSRLTVELDVGDSAVARLSDPTFVAAWNALVAACAWSTSFQSVAFVGTWYGVHRSQYEPIVVSGRDSDGHLVGLLPLARKRTGGPLVGAGDFHAEYQTWLAEDAVAEAFPLEAISTLGAAFPRSRLALTYVPAGTPLDWVPAVRGRPRPIQLRRRLGGFIDLGDKDRLEASLRKGHNRNRLNALRRLGDVRLESIETADELITEIDHIAVLCDIRQGAINDSLPFTNNPLKRDFHIELMRAGLLRITVLRVGTMLASAHLDMINGRDVLNYLTAYAPSLARQSPGSLHTLMLARHLADDGVERYDLSPGGGYKNRYATDHVTVHRLTIQFGLRDRIQADLADRTVRAATAVLALVGQTPQSARDRAIDLKARAMKRVSRGGVTESAPAFLAFSVPTGVAGDAGGQLVVDDLASLLRYDPVRWRNRVPKRAFLRRVLHRLEVGHHALTRGDGSVLRECWWAAPIDSPAGRRSTGTRLEVSSAGAVLVYGRSIEASQQDASAAGPDVVTRVARTVRADAPSATLIVAAAVDDAALIEALVRAGAARLGTVTPARLGEHSDAPSTLQLVAHALADSNPPD